MGGTWQSIIHQIMAWVTSPQETDEGPWRNIYWIYGAPGIGKTSLAHSICEKLYDGKHLAGAFFCQRDDPHLRKLANVISILTIALAGIIPPFRRMVADRLRKDQNLTSKTMMDTVFLDFIHNLPRHPTHTLVFVIDALDECGDDWSRPGLLEVLSEAAAHAPWLKVIITSRPEADIQCFFDAPSGWPHLRYDLAEGQDANTDLQTFTHSKFGLVASKWYLTAPWAFHVLADLLPIEIWRNILHLAVEPDVGPSVFATTCTASTFIHFMKQENGPYIEYTRRRATLRQVCRTWNQTLLSTDSWWTYVPTSNRSQRSIVPPSTTDQVPTIKRLSMNITDRECVERSVNWASDVLQRVQVPLITYDVNFPLCSDDISTCPKSHSLHDFLPGVGSNIALRRLRVVFPPLNSCRAISFRHLNANFKNLISLSLCNLSMLSTEELTLPHLELLHLTRCTEAPPSPTQGWNLPCLRHVWVEGTLDTPYINTWLKFLLRYASQLETLFLIMDDHWNDFPSDFWDSFTALQVLGLRYTVLNDYNWGGWIKVSSRTHPLRYLVCKHCRDVQATVNHLEPMWNYHEEVGLVVEEDTTGQCYLIEDTEDEGWETRMTKTDGILPDRRSARKSGRSGRRRHYYLRDDGSYEFDIFSGKRHKGCVVA